MSHEVFVVDDQHPEDLAMLQALYSRSPASVVTHLDKLKQSGSGKFMDQFYVGYGHASIGDCGATTCFIEQVSMLVAKAVQDNPLYNGQEASTRYLDFSKQAMVDPYKHPASTAIQNRWMEIYNATVPKLAKGLEVKYPFDPATYKNEKVWQNALLARAFDTARSLLPVGTTTLLSWSTTLRQARDNLRRLKHHPLPEVREVAQTTFTKLLERYPHSFTGDELKMDAETPRDAYMAAFAGQNHFLSPDDALRRFALTDAESKQLQTGEMIVRREAIDLKGLKAFEGETLAKRPANTPLPWRLESYGRYNFLFLLDFGSFRDIQRHRNGVCQIPLLDGRFGMHPWYVSQYKALLPAADAEALLRDIKEQFDRIASLAKEGVKVSTPLSQYLYPMGTMGLVQVSYSVPETVYVGELRSGKTVHPSLRPIAQKMLRVLAGDLPGIALHGDMDEDSWTAKRGEQTIAAKN
ncbi:MAG: FAD-dependent thymidylate synthase [Alphaproteobacteria bacterium]|nr:FAD-dependent thymidylate synthase [Alphaproteobacteria bacterium]